VAKMSNAPDAYVPYIAMNYFDRFLLHYDMTAAEGLTATEKVRLIAVSCYALSANRRINRFLLGDILIALDKTENR
ncbi:cyclin-D1-1, partial [Trifolium medium]|nr:cyclin-D1-1 [Trifolium medium]